MVPEIDLQLLERILALYDQSGPRYTSYPTAPAWSGDVGPEDFGRALRRRAGREEFSLYLHVPFCRSLCHFCACNRVITQKSEPVTDYLDSVAKEVETVANAIPADRPVGQLHWGGGTPTHLTPEQIRHLYRTLAGRFQIAADAEKSIEVDPRVTTAEHVDALRECGFRRISMGVQDVDATVQKAIHRIQPLAQTAELVALARSAGFRSVGIDLIYGLPFQTEASFAQTLDAVATLGADRIALYSYAHVTWLAKQQRGFERMDLPAPRTKLRLMVMAIRFLLDRGYIHVGMDHFAKPDDELAVALRQRTLRRNFMGYTTRAGVDLVGLGPSAISELRDGYFQSQRDLTAWRAESQSGRLATLRGHRLSAEDRVRRWAIERIMCHGEVRAPEFEESFGHVFSQHFAAEQAGLRALEANGLLVRQNDGGFALTPEGRILVRNVAMLFDAHLPEQNERPGPLFSRTV